MFVYFLRDITDPPKTVIIASINPAIGRPVCCIGIVVVVKSFIVSFLFVLFVDVVLFVLFSDTLIVIGSTPSVLEL